MGSKVVFERVDRDGTPSCRCWVAREWWHQGEERVQKKKKAGKNRWKIYFFDFTAGPSGEAASGIHCRLSPTVQIADADKWDLFEPLQLSPIS